MVTPIGTAKQTLRSIEEAQAWMDKCVDAEIAAADCLEATASTTTAFQSITKWLKEQA